MKYLLILGLVLAVLWLWRNNRRTRNETSQKMADDRPRSAVAVTEIVACDVCHVHLPRSEALAGPAGVYCCAAHRRQAGG